LVAPPQAPAHAIALMRARYRDLRILGSSNERSFLMMGAWRAARKARSIYAPGQAPLVYSLPGSNRLAGMIFSRPLVIESTLSAGASRERVRAFATSRDLPSLDAFRRRQIIAWKLSESKEDFIFQPEYGDSLNVEGARLVALVEPLGSGSRIRGHVITSPITRIVMSVFLSAVVIAAMATLAQGREPTARVLAIASLMLGAALLMVRYDLRSTSAIVEARLRQCLDASSPRAAA
jgi:hypothetical protein